MVRVGGGEFGVEVGNVGDEIDEVMELLGVVARDGGGGRDEDLALCIVREPLVVEFLGIRSRQTDTAVSKESRALRG